MGTVEAEWKEQKSTWKGCPHFQWATLPNMQMVAQFLVGGLQTLHSCVAESDCRQLPWQTSRLQSAVVLGFGGF